ncbi:MAG: response regulator [Nitrospirae bacterium]|nr:response regulator [Nitrospirota bacterium]
MTTHPSILLIDDSPGERELFRLALAQTGLDVTLYTEQDAEAAFHFFETQWMAHAAIQSYSLNHDRSQGEAGGMVSTARVERGPSQAARSASTETMPPASPSLILLDLNLCSQNGCDLLKRLRSDARFAAIPTLIFTTSDDPADLANSYSCGANGYVIKPGTFDELVHCITDLCRYWLTWNRPLMVETAC